MRLSSLFSFPLMKYTLLLMSLLVIRSLSWSQDSVWTLESCMQYAKDKSLSIRESKINERIAKMQVEQRKLSMLPSVSLSADYGSSFGRTINPTSNEFENSTYQYAGLSGGSSITLFGWFQNWHLLKKSKLDAAAATADREQSEYNTALNIAAAYLNVLLAKEQIKISEAQLLVSKQNIQKTSELRMAGKSNGLDASKVKTQLMQDSTSYLNAVLACKQSIIMLKAILNLDFNLPFEVAGNTDTVIPVNDLLSLNPEAIFTAALSRQAIIRGDELRLEVAREDLIINKRRAYPSLSFGYSFGTNYSSSFYEPLPDGTVRLMNWGRQLGNNISNSIYMSISIPVFNGLGNRFSVKQALFNIQQSELKQEENTLQLKQDIYKAWNDVVAALQVYNAAKSTTVSATMGYDYAQQRYDLGLISASDLVLAQKDRNAAMFDELSKKYDLLFKLKIIQYYQGGHAMK